MNVRATCWICVWSLVNLLIYCLIWWVISQNLIYPIFAIMFFIRAFQALCVCVCAWVCAWWGVGELMGCVQSTDLGARASPSGIYPAEKLQWYFTCGFGFRHSLWDICSRFCIPEGVNIHLCCYCNSCAIALIRVC